MSAASNRLLDTCVRAAVEAGRAAHAFYRGHLDVRVKDDASPVTAADLASEAVILDHLARECPAIPVVAEEQVASGRVPAPELRGTFFLVDPLDGTREFIEGREDFTVNIALIERGLPTLGVVYAPARAALYGGIVDAHLAFRQHWPPGDDSGGGREAIQVRSAPPGDWTAVASRSHASSETVDYLSRTRATRRVSVGSSLKFCLVAEGVADLYPRLGTTMEWDTAAGHGILLAAGGAVIARDGAPLRYGKSAYRNPWFVAAGADVNPPPLDGAT